MIFSQIDPNYSSKCLQHARELYKFASIYRGFYHKSIIGADQYYESSGYGDELAWAAAWFYKATNETKYLEDAEHHYRNFKLYQRPNEFFYNKKDAGVQVLLAQLTGKLEYRKAANNFCDYSVKKQRKTPLGLIFINKVGTLGHAGNIAFVCLEAADAGNIGDSREYREFARKQIRYMLGDIAGRSFVVGWGNQAPKQPYHVASSCPSLPATCGWRDLNKTEPNPQILFGALVSGPDENDKFKDQREDYIYTDVSLDYNSDLPVLLLDSCNLIL